jgi:CRP-like cAMP-binding protein
VLAILKPGSWFGETSLVLGEANTENATAVEHTVLAHIPATTFLDCLRRDRQLSVKILAEAFRRLEAALADTVTTSISSRERVMRWLLEEAARAHAGDRVEIAVPATKRMLASRLSMTGAHLSRMFRELKEAKLITVKGRRICVPSVARLEAYRASRPGRG